VNLCRRYCKQFFLGIFMVCFLAPLMDGIIRHKNKFDTIEMIVRQGLTSLDEFEKGKISLFDPSIGTEACQVTAEMMLEHLGIELQEARFSFNALLGRIKEKKEPLDTEIDYKIRQIVLCYILTVVKEAKADDKDPNFRTYHDGFKIRKLEIKPLQFDGAVVEQVCKKAKALLAQESVDFLQEKSKELKCERMQYLMQKMMPSAKNLPEVSFYHNVELVMRCLRHPIVLKARKPTDAYNDFRVTLCYRDFVPCLLSEKEPVMVIEGASLSLDSLSEMIEKVGGLFRVIVMNAAQHRPCTGFKLDPELLKKLGVPQDKIDRIMKDSEPKLLEELGVLQEEIDRMVKDSISKLLEKLEFPQEEIDLVVREAGDALTFGCGEKNMACFRIEHIYADTFMRGGQDDISK